MVADAVERLSGAPGDAGPRLDAVQPQVQSAAAATTRGHRPCRHSSRGRGDERQHQPLSAAEVDQRARAAAAVRPCSTCRYTGSLRSFARANSHAVMPAGR